MEGLGGGGRMSDILFENIQIENLYGGRPIAVEIVSDGTDTGSFLEVANKFDASLFHRRRCHNIHIGFRGTFIHTFGDIRRTSTYSFI